MGLKNPLPGNPIVFLDVRVGKEKVGRMIIELRKDVCPKTAENFRMLCRGDKFSQTTKKKLHYKGTRFHKVQRIFMIQGGDVIKNDGSSGESIYGRVFEDENFDLLHEEGAVSMANFSQPNTNNSQFFVTTVNCCHLDGRHVVVGYVLRGLGIIGEMEKFTTNEGLPTEDIIIDDCGEIEEGEDWNYHDRDETEDNLPPFPADWDQSSDEMNVDFMVEVLERIRCSGNHFYKKKDFVEANRKYNKMTRFYQFFHNQPMTKASRDQLDQINVLNCLNLAAVNLKNGKYKDVIHNCNEVLRQDPQNMKALYRRGVAQIELKSYDLGLNDLKTALTLNKDSVQAKNILNEFNRGKDLLLMYREKEKESIKKMFPIAN